MLDFLLMAALTPFIVVFVGGAFVLLTGSILPLAMGLVWLLVWILESLMWLGLYKPSRKPREKHRSY